MGERNDIILRQDLEGRIRADGRTVTLVVAPPGAGKSVLLQQLSLSFGAPVARGAPPGGAGEWLLWDDPAPGAALPVLAPGQRLVLACRPVALPEGLARARLYSEALELDSDDLLLPRALCRSGQWERSAGWPLLLSPAAAEDGLLRSFFLDQLLPGIGSEALWEALVAERPTGWMLAAVPPLARPRSPVARRLSRLLREAMETALGERLSEGERTPWLTARVAADPGPVPGLVARMIRRREATRALSIFGQAGGWYLYYRIGPDAFSALVAEFPQEADAEEVELSRAILALKAGEVQYVQRRLVERFGPGIADVRAVLRDETDLPLRVRIFRIVLLIYEDAVLTDALLEALFAFAAQIPLGDDVLRGSYYNAMLEFMLRLRRYDEAEDVAGRALRAYESGQVPLLAFYISVHRAVMRLLRGEPAAARADLDAARRSLARVGFESPGDARLLKLVGTVVRFEDGEPQPLIDFLENDLDGFSHGEIWPTLVELAVQYGSQALSEQVSTRAALSFLDHWRLYLALNRQFHQLVAVRKAQVLQNAGRWGEAARMLAPIQSRLDRVWMESAEEELERLTGRDEILLALSWLRQIAFERPRFPYLDRKLETMRQNPRLTGRQRLSLDIWAAYVARELRDHGRARALLSSAIDEAARRHSLSVLAEEQIFLSELWADRRMAEFLDASGTARAVRRRLEEGRHAGVAAAAREQLTRQELKVLMMLTDGASNKGIARRLGLTEPTVKFHLKNLYRKLGVNRRTDAVAAARNLGWIS